VSSVPPDDFKPGGVDTVEGELVKIRIQNPESRNQDIFFQTLGFGLWSLDFLKGVFPCSLKII
jgi:hypothetical protein